MDMFTATTKIMAIQRVAERQQGALFNIRSAKYIKDRCDTLLRLVAKGGSREQLVELVCWMRAESEWPGDLRGWTWFDDRLFVLFEYLAQDETFPTQAELVDELEAACRAGVLR